MCVLFCIPRKFLEFKIVIYYFEVVCESERSAHMWSLRGQLVGLTLGYVTRLSGELLPAEQVCSHLSGAIGSFTWCNSDRKRTVVDVLILPSSQLGIFSWTVHSPAA